MTTIRQLAPQMTTAQRTALAKALKSARKAGFILSAALRHRMKRDFERARGKSK